MSTINVSDRSRLGALILSLLGFTLLCGMHRLYVGKLWTGLLWLATGGLCGIGQIFDIVMILIGCFDDKEGRPVLNW